MHDWFEGFSVSRLAPDLAGIRAEPPWACGRFTGTRCRADHQTFLHMTLGTNIRRLRSVVGPRSQKKLAERLGVAPSQVADWEHDRYAVISIQSLIKLATVFHCSVDDLLAGVDADYDQLLAGVADAAYAAGNWPDVAVVGEGDAPPGAVARNAHGEERPAVLGWVPRPADLGDPHAYGVQIRGDAMCPAYRPKMVALVSPAQDVQDGDEVYAHLARGEHLVRLARAVPRGYIFQAYNPGRRARFVKHNEIDALHVIVYSLLRGLER
ncbi:MAG: LexA family transcriptional regulator [Acidobacteria bacterium]|nr:LexA family transcriptional regulator [Acidobacteriota bacterium]